MAFFSFGIVPSILPIDEEQSHLLSYLWSFTIFPRPISLACVPIVLCPIIWLRPPDFKSKFKYRFRLLYYKKLYNFYVKLSHYIYNLSCKLKFKIYYVPLNRYKSCEIRLIIEAFCLNIDRFEFHCCQSPNKSLSNMCVSAS